MMEDYGHRLLPSILHHVANNDPQRVFALVARSDDVNDGFDRITYRQVANGANYVTRWLQERFESGQEPSHHPTLTYVGPNDLRYNLVFYGAIQCRYKTKCTRLVHAAELASTAASLQQASGGNKLQCEQLPPLRELLEAPEVHYCYDLNYADVYKEPILILHSSGSTGRPKPVESTHGSFATIDVRDFPTVPDRSNLELATTCHFPGPESYMYDVFPLFHLAGFYFRVIVPLITGTVSIFDPPSRPPTGALVAKTIRVCEPRGLLFPPTIIEHLIREPDCERLFRQRDVVIYAGGPLAPETGSRISKWTTLCQFYGSTEVGQVRQLQPLPDDWAYLEFHPHEPFELQPLGDGSNLHELVLFTGEHLEKTSTLYHNYPDLTQWRTGDLFEPHAVKSNLWKFHARVDDILVFSSGQKLNPLPLESRMSTIAGVHGALIVGTRYPQPALILELGGEQRFMDPLRELWPSIEAANTLLPSHGRITRSMVLFTTPDKPFQRAAKGTVIRRQTEELYADEIRQLYDKVLEDQPPKLTLLRPSAFHVRDVRSLILSALNYVAIDSRLDSEENLFNHGLDSVKAAELVSILRTSLLVYKSKETLQWLTLETVYLNPTIDAMSNILLAFLNDDKMPSKPDSVEEIKTKIAEYSSSLPSRVAIRQQNRGHGPRNVCVAVTGTTGFFGQQLLSQLVTTSDISCIICLNRSPAARDRFQRLQLKHDKQLVFLRMDIGRPRLGLRDDDYALLSNNCNLVLHNAWQVDFDLPLGSFEVHLEGIRNIITMCTESVLHPRLVFISSIAATGVWTAPGSPLRIMPEAMMSVDCVAEGMNVGYAKSKLIAEHILEKAASEYGIQIAILRLGHILPATDAGDWPSNDVLALFLQTSKTCGRLAIDYLDTINWLPVNLGAKVVSEIVQGILVKDETTAGAQVFHVVNPQERDWSTVMETLVTWCGPHVLRVPMAEWVGELHKVDLSDHGMLLKFPALRILDLCDLWAKRGLFHQYSTDRSMVMSESMRALVPPGNGLLGQWLARL